MMVEQGRGLIVMISSMGGLKYLFNVPYGVGKAAVSWCALCSWFLYRSSNVLILSDQLNYLFN